MIRSFSVGTVFTQAQNSIQFSQLAYKYASLPTLSTLHSFLSSRYEIAYRYRLSNRRQYLCGFILLQSLDLLKKTISGYRVKWVNLINSFSNQRLTNWRKLSNGVRVGFSPNSASIVKLQCLAINNAPKLAIFKCILRWIKQLTSHDASGI